MSVNLDLKKECEIKFSKGGKIWSVLNNCFSMLPYASIIYNEVFCCHGGIPRGENILEKIHRISKSSTLGEIENELIWNDFYSKDDSTFNTFKNEPKFFENHERRIGFIVGEEAVKVFLDNYKFKHIFRAHQYSLSKREGYHINFDGRVYTLFSNSSYDILRSGNRNTPRNNTACIKLSYKNLNIEIINLVTRDTQAELRKSDTFEIYDLVDMKFKQ